MVIFIIVLLITGFAVGAVARLLLPGRDPIGIVGTIVLGIAGSFVGGFGENLIQYRTLSVRGPHPAGLVGSVIGALVLLLLLAPDRPGAAGAAAADRPAPAAAVVTCAPECSRFQACRPGSWRHRDHSVS